MVADIFFLDSKIKYLICVIKQGDQTTIEGRLRIMSGKKKLLFGLVDADMIDNGTRHPNLALLKIAGYLRDHNIQYRLITDTNADITPFDHIYLSRVFSFTHLPQFYINYLKSPSKFKPNLFLCGGTGWYATETDTDEFLKKRNEDFYRLEKDPLLPGINMKKQMPDYDLYKSYVEEQIAKGRDRVYYKDYLDYSIGFLTRGCFRHCSFCVNRLEKRVFPHSELADFVDKDRPYIYLWDDNFFAAPHKFVIEKLNELIATKKPFQFRQGLDIRLVDEEKAKLLNVAHYHGDMIFAFDNWSDRDIITAKLKIWKRYCPQKTTKFYLFCGFRLTPTSDEELFQDICELFWRIKILMSYGCLGYVMRHEDYKKHPLGNIYTQIARWCNQPQFYKKMSFHEFIDRNQYYVPDKTHKCMSLRTYEAFMEKFADKKDLLDELFDNIKFTSLINPDLWKEKKD